VSPQDRIKGFAKRPSNPDDWVRTPSADRPASQMPNEYTARLTVDVTPELRGRIKIAAFRRGLTAADMLRTLLEREFPPAVEDAGSAP
jgi:hypothetical protein